MFPTFSGNSRRPRNVNLSGRNQNPLTKSSQNAVANAQHDRVARQLERRRQAAANLLQRHWRGYRTRKLVKEGWRQQWDEKEKLIGSEPYRSEAESLEQLQLLLRFLSTHNPEDMLRLEHYFQHQLNSFPRSLDSTNHAGPWPLAYLRLENCCLDALEREQLNQSSKIQQILQFAAERIPEETARNSRRYYQALRHNPSNVELKTVLLPLQNIAASTSDAYAGFAAEYLTTPYWSGLLDFRDGSLDAMAQEINCMLLGRAVSQNLHTEHFLAQESKDSEGKVWLLARFIYFYRHAYQFKAAAYAANKDFVNVVASLLSSVANQIKFEASENDLEDETAEKLSTPADEFLREQISSLVNQESVGSILSATDLDSKILSSYILTILRLFPRRGDEIRMWLYLGLSPSNDNRSRSPVSAIKYFWQNTRATQVYQLVHADPSAAIRLLKPSGGAFVEDQWKIILMFIELYTFVLKIMDDEEFFSGNAHGIDSKLSSNFSRDNALPLDDVQELTTFLKHLGFTMYYNASVILESGHEISGNLSLHFRNTDTSLFKSSETDRKKDSDPSVAGIKGVTLDYMKGTVTGLLRLLYERDSRRPFMPKGHWLMTSRFDMSNFIDAVVEEEERRHKVQEEDDEDNALGNIDDEMSPGYAPLLGAGRAQNGRRLRLLQLQQRKASRERYLQAVAPRLEILQNMPFLIPFTTRVKIFRRFVHMDMLKRRHGRIDPEEWRLSQLEEHQFDHAFNFNRHHAKIRRDHEFDDAFQQFYKLGSGLKEPIQITFVDQFDTVEAGIDGGGVTKEFLTSVTNQAFAPPADGDVVRLFAENSQQLLYPNPAAIDQAKELLRVAKFPKSDSDMKITDILQRYEFLGRVIGKCLYEGILVDVRFAGFFLLKWALTGGTGSAPKESSYRANLNDLRDFDEALYQGLLQLKNYPGNVEEDFNLNFTVDDTISLPPATKTVTRDLKVNGENIPVTSSNRLVYISYMARHRLQVQPYAQTNAFLRGLAAIILPSWLSMFNQIELQTLVSGGEAPISIPDLRANTIYGGVYVIGTDGLEHPSVQLFWAVMEELPDAERRKVLKFVTSTPRAPLLGFGALNPRFSLRDSGRDESRLPSTSTCVNLLKLPMYTDAGRLKQKLLQAVNSGAGFDLS